MFRRYHAHQPAPAPAPAAAPHLPTPGMLEARAARGEARDGLLAAIHRGPEVREVVRQVQEHGRRNHFFDLLAQTLPYGEEPHR